MQTDHFAFLKTVIEEKGSGPRALVPILLAIQEKHGYLPTETLNLIPKMTQITAAAVKGVMTYYSHFRLNPAGRHTIRVCIGTACYVRGAEQTYQAFRAHLKIGDGDTDPNRLFTIARVACLGCCMLAPAVQIDDLIYGWVYPAEVGRIVDEFLEAVAARAEKPLPSIAGKDRGEVKICLCSSCLASGAKKIYDDLLRWSARYTFPIRTTQTGCTGMSFEAPLIKVTAPEGKVFYYGRVNSERLDAILLHHFKPRSLDALLQKLLYMDTAPAASWRIDLEKVENQSWLATRNRVVMEGCMEHTPCDLDVYRQNGGFSGFEKALRLKPTEVIDMVVESGLRGRGGAGFPTGTKWRAAASASGNEKFVICNADEGDPGAFMDRMLLESAPYRIIEGMMIAGHATGARQGLVFVRKEYPLAVKRMKEAIAHCEKQGLLGGETFCLEIVESAGAFVCGEETALIASIEGERGIPRERPPYPAEKGLFDKPTLINNVETFAAAPWILAHGASAFRNFGTQSSPGTKTFALAGKVNRGGLIEVPMGTTIRAIIYDIGGGGSGNAAIKAVQIGGPSGGCLPESLFDLPVDFESLKESGAIMGSGGMVVLDEHDCMVDIARYFLEFTAGESCGDCSFCRVGSQRMLEILGRLCKGKAHSNDIEQLERLSAMLRQGSRCGLGKTAPNPVLTTLRYFRDEYKSHLDGFCPAGKCPSMFMLRATEKCNGCMICARHCPVDAIPFQPWNRAEIDTEKCVRCGVCRRGCPEQAIEVVKKAGGKP